MTTNRPVFLDFWHLKLPISGLVSILHRISGVMMVACVPVLAAMFALALSGPEGFAASVTFFDHPLIIIARLLLGWAVLHHLFAGVRHLFLDLGWGVELPVARTTAWTVLVAAVVMVIVGGGVLI
jgi:succinate dehydrogenase / fumarate reductase cytochrome b subunit